MSITDRVAAMKNRLVRRFRRRSGVLRFGAAPAPEARGIPEDEVFYKVLSQREDGFSEPGYYGLYRNEPSPYEGISQRGMDLFYRYCSHYEGANAGPGITDQMTPDELRETADCFSKDGKEFEVVRFSRNRDRIGTGLFYGIDVVSAGAYSMLGEKGFRDRWSGFPLNRYGLFGDIEEAEKYVDAVDRLRLMNRVENEDVFPVFVERVL